MHVHLDICAISLRQRQSRSMAANSSGRRSVGSTSGPTNACPHYALFVNEDRRGKFELASRQTSWSAGKVVPGYRESVALLAWTVCFAEKYSSARKAYPRPREILHPTLVLSCCLLRKALQYWELALARLAVVRPQVDHTHTGGSTRLCAALCRFPALCLR